MVHGLKADGIGRREGSNMAEPINEFPYSKVVITGGAGFVGSQVVSNLRALGIEPFIARSHGYDLRYADRVQSLLNATRPELVIHLAANCGGIGYNQKNGNYSFNSRTEVGHID